MNQLPDNGLSPGCYQFTDQQSLITDQSSLTCPVRIAKRLGHLHIVRSGSKRIATSHFS